MSFKKEEVAILLAKCRRHCCICYQFCGIKIETDHMVPKGEGGTNDIENAIPLCFECHAEVHLYNDKHPRGRKYTPAELKQHKKQWLSICTRRPDILLQKLDRVDSGVLSAVISELEFNLLGADLHVTFETREFHNAISNGILSLLKDDIKFEIMNIYVVLKRVNETIRQYNQAQSEGRSEANLKAVESELRVDIAIAKEGLKKTINLMRKSLNE